MRALDLAATPQLAAIRAPRLARVKRGLAWTAWATSALVACAFLAQPVGPSAQLALAATAGLAMLVLWCACPKRGLPRMAFLALGTTVVVRYVYWRLSGTLPGMDDPLSLALGLVLVAAELYCVLILAVSLIVNADPLERAPAPVLSDDALPSVDVFVPSYNESREILAVTLAAACNLDYPAGRVTVWLLDDGGTDQKCADPNPEKAAAARARRTELQALCADLGARYLTRARNEHAKAGNMNSGLKSATADLVLVLDADHAPFRSFLRETVGHFSEDPKLFLVQTPHVFLNPDPVERNLRTFAAMPSENEMFYAVTQRGLDKWNGSFFCGSAALLRRKALDEVGGFSGITITEDCETAFELHARGWTSAYVDKPLIAGLQPETFADFIGQRSRWCQGMFQIMILKNPLTKPGLKAIQRLAYLSSMAYWFFPLPRLIFMLAPLLHIFLDVKIFVSSIDEALAFTATYVVANMTMQNYLYGHVRWPWVSELYEYVQGVHLARSIVAVIASPRKPTFTVTAKGVSLDADHLSGLAKPFFAIFLALLVGCATATYRYLYEPGVTSLMLVVGLWCLFNLVIAGAALGVVAERRQPERCPSLPTARRGRVSIGAELFDVAIERASSEGATLRRLDGGAWPAAARGGEALDGASIGTLAVAPLPGCAAFEPLAFDVRATPEGAIGSVVFAAMTTGSYRALADLVYGDAVPLRGFLEGRRQHKSLLAGSLRFIAWGLVEPLRAASYAAQGLRGRKSAAPEALAAASAPVEASPAAAEATIVMAFEAVVALPLVGAELAPLESDGAPAGDRARLAHDHVVAVDTQPIAAPLTAEAWRSAVLELLEDERMGTGVIVTGFDAFEWRACVAALDAAERKPEERSAGTPGRPEAALVSDPLIERREPSAYRDVARNAA